VRLVLGSPVGSLLVFLQEVQASRVQLAQVSDLLRMGQAAPSTALLSVVAALLMLHAMRRTARPELASDHHTAPG
jgi:hypothetical protein